MYSVLKFICFPLSKGFVTTILITVVLSACVGAPPTRMGMVKDPDTGLMIGSRVENSIITDASFHKNNKIKVRIRNTSGDIAFDLNAFRSTLENAYANAGYVPTSEGDFGILVDVNVRYSGHIQANLEAEYGFLGAAVGGITGYRSGATTGTAMGVVAGATLGSIAGSFATEDTYIIVTNVTYASVKDTRMKKPSKTVTFSRSRSIYNEEKKKEKKRGLKTTITTGVAVYAGGRNTPQSVIAEQVRERIARIASNII
ncbi:complement resistance protein TraT [Rhodospirillales bacterium]|nr:complement resistance protein TraT [Rhodospirillales bacterium]